VSQQLLRGGFTGKTLDDWERGSGVNPMLHLFIATPTICRGADRSGDAHVTASPRIGCDIRRQPGS